MLFRILQFGCPLCSFKLELMFTCKEHMESDHENWRDDLKALPGHGATKAPVHAGPSPHTNPNWLHNLTTNFMSLVVDKSSSRCRQAL